MPIISELGGTFDTVAAAYEKMRPGYPAGLYDTVFRYINIDENSTVGEVGIGAGQATPLKLFYPNLFKKSTA